MVYDITKSNKLILMEFMVTIKSILKTIMKTKARVKLVIWLMSNLKLMLVV